MEKMVPAPLQSRRRLVRILCNVLRCEHKVRFRKNWIFRLEGWKITQRRIGAKCKRMIDILRFLQLVYLQATLMVANYKLRIRNDGITCVKHWHRIRIK